MMSELEMEITLVELEKLRGGPGVGAWPKLLLYLGLVRCRFCLVEYTCLSLDNI